MKVSVIVTTHNTERYLLKCMDSIFNQTLSDIEIIIADDASTDSTPQIATELAKTHENVLFLPLSTSLGPGGARNKALQQASGEYISFIDSDDWMDLNYLEVMYNKAQQLNADIVTCSLCIFRKNCASVPEERSAIPLQTEQSSAGLLVAIIYSTIPARKFKTICLGCHSA